MADVKAIDAKTAKEWFDKNEAIIVDVREPDEYGAGHIAGATLIPLGSIEKNKLPPLANKKLIIHCQLGRRGKTACEKLLASDPTLDIYNLEGGINAWQQAGFKVETSEAFTLPMMRQVLVTMGSGVLLGVIAGYMFHSIFFLLSAICGAGLLYTGVTGSTDLENMLKKLPWNQRK